MTIGDIEMTDEDLAEMRMVATAAMGLFPRVEIDPAHVLFLLDGLAARDAALDEHTDVLIETTRSQQAAERLLTEREHKHEAVATHNVQLIGENARLRSLLKEGFAYVRDANRLMAAEVDIDEDDEDGANEWLESAAAALV